MSDGGIYAGGLQLDFFESAEFEKPLNGELSDEPEMAGRNLLRILMMGWREDWRDLASWKLLKAIFSERNHDFTRGLRLAFQQGFTHLYSQLEGKTLLDLQRNQAELYLANCLALLPYADITPYESFTIPQWVNEQWQLVDYKVMPIELTPTSGFTKLFLANDDRVFAYGLEPMNNSHASPHLIFMGTTYLAGQGFHTQVDTDLESFATVGNKIYCSGRANIGDWLDKQTKKVHVCGTSLGGSLSLLLAIDHGEKLSRVDALNPAGLYNSWGKNNLDHWDEQVERPEVFVQKQADDPVSMFGVWKPQWNILNVTPEEDKKGPNGLTDHALNYAGFAGTTFTKIDVELDNQERKHRDFWLYTMLRSIFSYLVVTPFRYVFLPLWRYVSNHKLQLTLTAGLFTLFFLVPVLATGFVIPVLGATLVLALNALAIALAGAYLLTNIIWFVSDQFTGKNASDLSKLSDWFLTRSIDARATIPVLAIALVLLMVVATYLPFVVSAAILCVASIPLIVKGLVKIGSWIKTCAGMNRVDKPECQDPLLPRNEEMDIYNNSARVTFTYKKLGDYYRARRCLLNDKDFLPDSKKKSNVLFEGFSKRDVLEKSLDESINETTITLETSKAKIHSMNEIAALVNRYGFNRDNQVLMHKLAEYESGYQSGKVKLLNLP